MGTRLAWNSQRSGCLCLLSIEVKDVRHYSGLAVHFLNSSVVPPCWGQKSNTKAPSSGANAKLWRLSGNCLPQEGEGQEAKSGESTCLTAEQSLAKKHTEIQSVVGRWRRLLKHEEEKVKVSSGQQCIMINPQFQLIAKLVLREQKGSG